MSFIVDIQLGKLAKALRILGFDTAYQNNFTESDIAKKAEAETRTVLTRNARLLKNNKIRIFLVRSEYPEHQLEEIIRHFDLADRFKPFERCLVCNGQLGPVEKESILFRLPPDTIKYYDEFFQCSSCKRLYWKGSHYERMMRFVQDVRTLFNS